MFADCCGRCAVWWLLVGSLAGHGMLCHAQHVAHGIGCGAYGLKICPVAVFLYLINVFSVAVVCAVRAAVRCYGCCVAVDRLCRGHVCQSRTWIC